MILLVRLLIFLKSFSILNREPNDFFFCFCCFVQVMSHRKLEKVTYVKDFCEQIVFSCITFCFSPSVCKNAFLVRCLIVIWVKWPKKIRNKNKNRGAAITRYNAMIEVEVEDEEELALT